MMNAATEKIRNLFANNQMAALVGETRKLIDEFGYDGAETYLQAQIEVLREMAALDDLKRNGDENDGVN